MSQFRSKAKKNASPFSAIPTKLWSEKMFFQRRTHIAAASKNEIIQKMEDLKEGMRQP
jgi:hypothetical protein